MKPTFQFNQTRRGRDAFAAGRMGSPSPRTDCHFQARAADFGHCGNGGSPSFRGISREYFLHEAPGHFAAEALVFGLIALTAAVPVIEGIRGLAHFVYGVL